MFVAVFKLTEVQLKDRGICHEQRSLDIIVQTNCTSVTFIERFVHFCLKSHEPMSLFFQ